MRITIKYNHFSTYIKTVIDIENKICSAGADRHFESEKILLDFGSKQGNIWGGGIDTNTNSRRCIDVQPNFSKLRT